MANKKTPKSDPNGDTVLDFITKNDLEVQKAVTCLVKRGAKNETRKQARVDIEELLRNRLQVTQTPDRTRRADLTRMSRELADEGAKIRHRLRRLWRRAILLDQQIAWYSPFLFKPLDVSAEATRLSAARQDAAGILPDPGQDFENWPAAQAFRRLEEYYRLLFKKLGSDSGGATTLEREFTGSTKRRLVADAGLLFSTWRPHEITATPGGQFHMFCAALFEIIAAERGPGFLRGLNDYVEDTAPLIRDLEKLWPTPDAHPRVGSGDPANPNAYDRLLAIHQQLQLGPKVKRVRKTKHRRRGRSRKSTRAKLRRTRKARPAL